MRDTLIGMSLAAWEAMGQIFESTAKWSMLALATLLPLFILPSGAITTPQAKLLLATTLIAVAVASWAFAVFMRGSLLPRTGLVIAAAFLPVAYTFSALLAGWSDSSVVSGLGEQDTVVAAGLWFAALVVAAALFGKKRDQAVLLRATLVGGIVLVIFQYARLFFGEALSFGPLISQMTTAVGSWHDLGIVLGLYVILGTILYRAEAISGSLWCFVAFAAALLSLSLLVIVNMVDVWLTLAGIFALLTAYLWFVGSASRFQLAVVACVCVAAIALGYFGDSVQERLPASLQVVAIEVRPSWGGTLSIGREAASESRALFFGSGPNSFTRNWALYKPAEVNATQFWGFDFSSGVGTVPTSFVTLGVFGFFAWLAVSAVFLVALVKEFRAAPRPLGAGSLIRLAVAGVALYLLAFHVAYAPGVAISALLFVFLGLFAAGKYATRSTSDFSSHVSHSRADGIYEKVGAGILAVLALAACGLSAQALASDIVLNKGIQAYAETGDIAVSAAHLQQSLMIRPSNDRAHRAAVELGILRIAEQVAGGDKEAAELQATLSATIQHGLMAVEIDRNDYQNWLTLAILYKELAGVGVEGAYEQAREAFLSARKENPTNPLLAFRLAQLEAARGNGDEAIKNLNEAVELKPDFAAAYYFASQLFAAANRLGEATQSATVAAQLAPGESLAWYNLGTILYAAGQYEEAAVALGEAVNLQNDYSNALFMRALALYKTGAKAETIALLMRVAELNPENETVPKVIANVNAGEEALAGAQ